MERERVYLSTNGSSLWVPKGALSTKSKFPAKKTILWHQRLGHIGEKGLQTLKNKNIVDGLNDYNLKFNFCEHCIYGKKIVFNFTQVLISPHVFWI